MSLTVSQLDPAHLDELALADERQTWTWRELDPVLNRAANAMGAAVDQRRRGGCGIGQHAAGRRGRRQLAIGRNGHGTGQQPLVIGELGHRPQFALSTGFGEGNL